MLENAQNINDNELITNITNNLEESKNKITELYKIHNKIIFFMNRTKKNTLTKSLPKIQQYTNTTHIICFI